MLKLRFLKSNVTMLAVAAAFICAAGCPTIQGANLAGSVQVAGRPVAGANVTLYAAGIGAPQKLGASIMEQFKIMGQAMLAYPKPTGVVHMFRPDGSQAEPAGYTGGGPVDVPWGLNIDGNDDVWIGDLSPRNRAVVLMAGANPKGRAAGTKPGDVIHQFKGGSIQMLTDVAIDPAGNVWAANNWNSPEAAALPNPPTAISTWGGGSGLTVIYGVAAPVKPPRMGKVQTY